MENTEKTCPDCAESVKAQARICRFCGFEFDAAAQTNDDAQSDIAAEPPQLEQDLSDFSAKPEKSESRVLFWFLGISLAIYLFTLIPWPDAQPSSNADLTSENQERASDPENSAIFRDIELTKSVFVRPKILFS